MRIVFLSILTALSLQLEAELSRFFWVLWDENHLFEFFWCQKYQLPAPRGNCSSNPQRHHCLYISSCEFLGNDYVDPTIPAFFYIHCYLAGRVTHMMFKNCSQKQHHKVFLYFDTNMLGCCHPHCPRRQYAITDAPNWFQFFHEWLLISYVTPYTTPELICSPNSEVSMCSKTFHILLQSLFSSSCANLANINGNT